MAYKDEYEVARLHLDPAERAAVTAEFGEGAHTSVQLHPPVLKALGLKRKISLAQWRRRPSTCSEPVGACAAPAWTRSGMPRCAGPSGHSSRSTAP